MNTDSGPVAVRADRLSEVEDAPLGNGQGQQLPRGLAVRLHLGRQKPSVEGTGGEQTRGFCPGLASEPLRTPHPGLGPEFARSSFSTARPSLGTGPGPLATIGALSREGVERGFPNSPPGTLALASAVLNALAQATAAGGQAAPGHPTLGADKTFQEAHLGTSCLISRTPQGPGWLWGRGGGPRSHVTQGCRLPPPPSLSHRTQGCRLPPVWLLSGVCPQVSREVC